jgi:hypothetical protein
MESSPSPTSIPQPASSPGLFWDAPPLPSSGGSPVLVYGPEIQQELAAIRSLLAIGMGILILLLSAMLFRKW